MRLLTFQLTLGSQRLGKLPTAMTTALGTTPGAYATVASWLLKAAGVISYLESAQNLPESLARHLTSLYQLNYKWAAGWGAATFTLWVNFKWQHLWFGMTGLHCGNYRRSKVRKLISEAVLSSARCRCRDADLDSWTSQANAAVCIHVYGWDHYVSAHLVGAKMLPVHQSWLD